MKRPFATSQKIDKILNYPHKNYPIVHVTGTNGKGSVSNMIASILIEAGYKVGTFNTPCIFDETDITKINGKPISLEKHRELSKIIDDVVKDNRIKPMFISSKRAELSFMYFNENNVDIAVVEADLGAANDSTGIITPIVSLLTNITEEHLNLFSNNYLEYVHEKVGIIKPNIPIYVSETPHKEEAKEILFNKAKECNAPLTLCDDSKYNLILEYYGDGVYNTIFGEVSMTLGGDYQKENLNLVLNAIQELRKQNYTISNDNIINGLNKIYENTMFCGRWQFISKKPRIILDCCHNVDAWEKVLKQISNMEYEHLHMIIETCKDKDVDNITKMFPDSENISYWFPIPRAERLIKTEELMEKTDWMIKSKRSHGFSIEKIIEDLNISINENDAIIICGTCKIINRVLTKFKEIGIAKKKTELNN